MERVFGILVLAILSVAALAAVVLAVGSFAWALPERAETVAETVSERQMEGDDEPTCMDVTVDGASREGPPAIPPVATVVPAIEAGEMRRLAVSSTRTPAGLFAGGARFVYASGMFVEIAQLEVMPTVIIPQSWQN